MYEKPCNLAKAAKYFGGKGGSSGGGGDINVPSFRQVLGDVTSSFPRVARTYRNFVGNEPYFQWQNPLLQQLSQMAPGLANTFTGQPGQFLQDASMLRGRADQLRQQFQDVPGQMLQGAQQFGRAFQGLPGELLRGADRIRGQFQNVPRRIMKDAGQYRSIMQGILPIARTGELTQDQRNEAIQQARSGAQARGDIGSNSAIFAEAMNRRKYADVRQNQAIGQALQLGQGAAGLDQMAQTLGISREQAAAQLQQAAQGLGLQRQQGIAGLQQGALNMAAGREGAAMGLNQGALGMTQGGMQIGQGMEQLLGYPSQQLTQAELGQTGAFGNLINPMYGLAGQQLQANVAGQTANAGQPDQGKQTLNTVLSLAGTAATVY